jgi:DNA-binding transcriptional ArsR family regulator
MRSEHSMEDGMTVTGPRVKNFTGDPARFPVEVVSAPVFELLMSLFAYSEMTADSPTEFTAGADWLGGVRSNASPELLATLDRLAGVGEIWVGLIGTALTISESCSIRDLVSTLRTADPVEQRLDYIVRGCLHCRDEVDSVVQRRAAEGDPTAIDQLAAASECRLSNDMRRLLEIGPAEAMELLADAVELFDRDLFHGGKDIAAVLDRDAEHKRALAKTMNAPQLVELATNGVTFEMQTDVDGIVLIPSVVLRPWVTIAHRDRKRIFCYPVAEEHLTADPDSPPMRLIEIYKALGDERRLRLMRLLIDGPISLAEITERIDLAKSTVHHHLSILRQAGLVLITLGADKEYSLRQDALPEAAGLLAGFLTPTTKE